MTGGRLYEVQVDLGEVLHRADMRLVDAVEAGIKRETPTQPLVEQYWRGDLTGDPIVELLVSKARVVREIEVTPLERTLLLKELARQLGLLPDDDEGPLYASFPVTP